MIRVLRLLPCLALTVVLAVGCSEKAQTERKEVVSGPGGTTTTTDTHKVESSGGHPPANTAGERAK